MKQQPGFVALSTVLIISAVTLVVASTVGYLSIGEIQSAFALYKGEENLQFVEGCVEDAMLKIRSNSSYSETSFTMNGATCNITYNDSGPVNWDLTISPAVTSVYNRKIRVQFTRSDTEITLTSWKEI